MALKQLPVDFKEFILSLNSNNVRYLLLGCWAVGIYGHPRATKDIDFIIAVDDENLANLMRALAEFGGPPVEIDKFREKGNVFRMGSSPVQLYIINDASGITFEDCYERRNTINVEGIPVSLISKADLIHNKMSSGRPEDRTDAEKIKNV